MEKIRKYIICGSELNVPLCYDEPSGAFAEDYSLWINGDKFTSSGYPILLSLEDACEFAENTDCDKCMDCGSCRFYKRAAKHSLIGLCLRAEKKKIFK